MSVTNTKKIIRSKTINVVADVIEITGTPGTDELYRLLAKTTSLHRVEFHENKMLIIGLEREEIINS